MSRYVDIEGDWVDDAVKAYSLGYYDDDEYAIPFEALGSAPSIDIVRCEECKFSESVITSWSTDGKNNMVERLCKVHKWSVKADDFCSYGERESK